MSPTTALSSPVAARSFASAVLPVMAVVLLGFAVIGLALPVLPRHVHDGLGFGPFTVGLVTGAQFATSLTSRFWSGDFADRRGGKRAIVLGLAAAAVGGGLYLLSLPFVERPVLSVSILLAGRAVIGGAESLIITGAMSLGLSRAGPLQTGQVIAWVGTAMFAALALGSPLGAAIDDAFGLRAIALATVALPFVAMIALAPLEAPPVRGRGRSSIAHVLGGVWLPGLGAALGSVGFGSILTFSVLLFADRGWGLGWLAVTSFAAALIAARLLLGQLADRFGGARIAGIAAPVGAAGQALVWLAPAAWIALAGCALTGICWALVYPAFGVEAVRRSPPENRGLAMGAYSAFPDLALGLSGPALGLLASGVGLDPIFLASGALMLYAVPAAIVLQRGNAVSRPLPGWLNAPRGSLLVPSRPLPARSPMRPGRAEALVADERIAERPGESKVRRGRALARPIVNRWALGLRCPCAGAFMRAC
ncbi:arabinose transporter [Aureimonas pseudogalii]|uniref:MFS family permease n=1 Tax=Aureimonas pseudogalii TaxID=1744844 RepID=A0A7W6H6E9_9HYPH|nr:arabinose transporter [Aureimonas pseudogalii]MBB3999424.1 MFS family permease [Aureimonas pseudogalii]